MIGIEEFEFEADATVAVSGRQRVPIVIRSAEIKEIKRFTCQIESDNPDSESRTVEILSLQNAPPVVELMVTDNGKLSFGVLKVKIVGRARNVPVLELIGGSRR